MSSARVRNLKQGGIIHRISACIVYYTVFVFIMCIIQGKIIRGGAVHRMLGPSIARRSTDYAVYLVFEE